MTKLFILACILAAFPTHGQSTAEKEVIAIVDQLFAGMRKSDSAAVRQVFASEAQLHTVSDDLTLQQTSLAQFLAAIGTPHDEVWDEQIIDYEVRTDGPLATVWTPYRFYRGEAFSHCGTNAFQLYRSSEGWKILQVTDTRKKEGCE